jgi:hypothetical protein
MIIGDGVRRNVAKIPKEERDLLRDAIIAMHKEFHFSGGRNDIPAGGVSYWFMQDNIHQGTHVHGGPAFLTWHRELCNRFEDLLREYDKRVSLHYWDCNYDPTKIPNGNGNFINLFTNDFMGNSDGTVNNGDAGEPWLSAGFYNPNITDDKYRSDDETDIAHSNPYDPPKNLRRAKKNGPPNFNTPIGEITDDRIINAKTYKEMREMLEISHNICHNYIGGNLRDGHISFRDPFVFLLHSNVDRLFAMWQYQNAKERLNPQTVYGEETNSTSFIDPEDGEVKVGIVSLLAPWAGYNEPPSVPAVENLPPRSKWVRPWAPPENLHIINRFQNVKTSKHISVVIPRKYDSVLEMLEIT